MTDGSERDAAQSAIYKAIVTAIAAGHTTPQALHHLGEAYALVTTPSRSSSGAAAVAK